METNPQNLWDAAKAGPRKKFTVTEAHLETNNRNFK